MAIINGRDFAKCIDAYCNINEITKEQLENKTGISTANLAQWRAGGNPSKKKIASFEKFSNMTAEDFLSLFLGNSRSDIIEQIKFLNSGIKHLSGKEIEEARVSLEFLQELLMDYSVIEALNKETPAAQGGGLNDEQLELMRIFDELDTAGRAALLADANALAAARKSLGEL